MSDDILRNLGKILSTITLDKKHVGWDLEALEASALSRVRERSGPDSDDESRPDESRRSSDDEGDPEQS